jgi:hypothetical protein
MAAVPQVAVEGAERFVANEEQVMLLPLGFDHQPTACTASQGGAMSPDTGVDFGKLLHGEPPTRISFPG